MHIDWNWIKQRPHFLAEELSKYYEVTVIYTYGYNRKLIKVKNGSGKIRRILPLFRVPTRFRNSLVGSKLNNFIIYLQFKRLGKDFDYVWLTSPTYIYSVIRLFKNSKIIYDCMDDNIGIKDIIDRKAILAKEEHLLKIADKVFVSSSNLINIVKKRGYDKVPVLVNNGISDFLLSQMKDEMSYHYKKRVDDNFLELAYIGTISYWFDFDKVLKLLSEIKNIRITLFGPLEIEIPKSDRIVYKGIVEYFKLKGTISNYDVLIMPFVINDLILSVDPVKLYEYISFRKNIIASSYPEVEKFKDFVFLYNNYNELKEIVLRLLENNELKYDPNIAYEFLKKNTWTNRANEIYKFLEDSVE